MRLDQALRALHPELSWARVRRAILQGQVDVDGQVMRDPAAEITRGSAVRFNPSRRALPHARFDLPRLYEDEEILVIDKPAGLLTVPTDGTEHLDEDTVLRRAQDYARRLHRRGGYAGVLHRLDRDTSGALALALSREAHREGRALFASHQFERWYLALVEGVPRRTSGTIEGHISNAYSSGRRRIVSSDREGRHAITHYRVRETYGEAALLELQLGTGRQHQIRLHLQQLGHPLIGERVYTHDVSRVHAPRQMLHAWRLEFPHPTQRVRIAAEAPIPADMAKALRELRRKN